MSSSVDVAAPEQLCYIPCNYCNIVLAHEFFMQVMKTSPGALDFLPPCAIPFLQSPPPAQLTVGGGEKDTYLIPWWGAFELKIFHGEDVSVPCSSLFDIVTVRCGHCTNLWSVNMAAAFQSLSWQDVQLQAPNYTGNPEYRIDLGSSSKAHNNKIATTRPSALSNRAEERTVNRPPEKRQRVPSAYNQFIKEEIQRIKANNPDISHREAFSTAAKNWAHFPHIHFGLMLETNVNHQTKIGEGSEKRLMPKAALLNK